MFDAEIPASIKNIDGNISLWIEDLITCETLTYRPDAEHIAASVIKLGIMLSSFKAFEVGKLDPNEIHTVKKEDKVPSCGALTYMHDGIKVTYMDIVTLMIILSDNTATNIMIDKLGIDQINKDLDEYNLSSMRLRRKMFDCDASARGLQNTITARSIADFYRRLYEGSLISRKASNNMLEILKNQRLNGKIPFFLHEKGIVVAHKTGEDDGVSHDAGIIYSKQPIIAVFLGNDTSVPTFERAIQDISLKIAGK